MKDTLKNIVMEKFEMNEKEAELSILAAKEQLQEYMKNGEVREAYNICEEYFGLEPDYLMELI